VSLKFKITLVSSLGLLLILLLLGYILFTVINTSLQREMAVETQQTCNEAAYVIEKSVNFDISVLRDAMARRVVFGSGFPLAAKLSALQDIARRFECEYILLIWDGVYYQVSEDSRRQRAPETDASFSAAGQAVSYGRIFSDEEAGLLIAHPAALSEDGVQYQMVLKRSADWVWAGFTDSGMHGGDRILVSTPEGQVLYPRQFSQITTAAQEEADRPAMAWITLSGDGAPRDIYACSMKLRGMPFSVTSYVHQEDIDAKLWEYETSYVLLAGCSAVLIAAIIFLLSRHMARLVAGLAKVVESADRPDEVPAVFTRRGDEAGVLARAVSSLLMRLQSSIEEKEYIAYHDNLTDLPNRYLMEQDITELLLEDSRFALALLDIDNFKSINDRYGHLKGDLVVFRLAALLQSVGPQKLKAYRWGGDEFVLMLLSETKAEYREVLDEIMQAVSAGFEGLEPIKISVSIGVCAYPEHAESQTALLQNADKALAKAKRYGKNQYVFYE
jgi:diguanylate cyclase (GGDEF) domain